MAKEECDKMLERAKIHLMLKPGSVFYSTILFSLKQSWSSNLPTAGTDGTNLMINKKWFMGLTDAERIGLLAHEVMHVALSHMTRRGKRDPQIWNYAGDFIINNELKRHGYTLPKTDCIDSQYKDMNTEQVYEKLYLDHPPNSGGSGIGDILISGIGQDILYPKNPQEVQVTEQKVADIVMQAAIQAKSSNDKPGSIPGEVEIQLESILNPKLPWNVILQNYLTRFTKDDYTWQRPNRRYLPEHYLPTAHTESICNIAVAVDSSGSVLQSEFNYFIREIASIRENLKPDKITLVDFDTRIRSIQEINESTNILKDLKFKGGGGTDVHDLLKWAKKNNPDVMLIFTDGEFSMPGSSCYPTCPVIWLIHDGREFTSPFGEIINYDIN